MTSVSGLLIAMAILSICSVQFSSAAANAAPPNSPAEVQWNRKNGSINIRYADSLIFSGNIMVKTETGERPVRQDEITLKQASSGGDKVEQVLHFSCAQSGSLVVRATALASDEAFAAETPSDAQKRFPLVRTSVGQSHNLRNNAIYDRHLDWLLSGPGDSQTRITPNKPSGGRTSFSIECRGGSIELTFRPRYYQKHKGVKYFEPWATGKLRQDSVTGWCSWWPYRTGFDQSALTNLLDIWREQHLADFGYRFIQIDDCFQTGMSKPEHWLNWNSKFPDGIQGYSDAVREAGFVPGVWIAAAYHDKPVPEQEDWFIRNSEGRPHSGAWVGHIVDATIPAAADALVSPIYRGIRDANYGYVKIDTLRHRLYDGINHCLEDIEARGVTPDELFRSYLEAARAELGQDTFLLACWGVLPEAAGIADACRLGGDGFGPSTLQYYNSWNGVVWRNDPDHCDILPARKAVDSGNVLQTEETRGSLSDSINRPTIVSMAGGVLMLSDRAEVYRDSRVIEGARRASPVLFSVPGQMYDYDTRCSDNVVTAPRASIKSGAGESPVDAPQYVEVCPWWMMEIDRPFEHWAVLSRFNFSDKSYPAATVGFRDLGLSGDQLVWEFWTRRLISVRDGSFEAEALPAGGTRTYAIRPRLNRPQILSTSRHISQGGADLERVTWSPSSRTLAGRSRVVNGDEYVVVVHVPEGYVLRRASVAGYAAATRTDDRILQVACTPSATGAVDWVMQFDQAQ